MKEKIVIAVVGLPTTGKTTLGRELARITGLHFVDIDEGPAACAPPPSENPWSSEETRAYELARMSVAYSVLNFAIESNLKKNFSVIVAAPYRSQEYLVEAAGRGGGVLKIIWCQYDDTPEEVERRMDRSMYRGTCSSVARYFELKAKSMQVIVPHIVVRMDNGEEGLKKALRKALAYINE